MLMGIKVSFSWKRIHRFALRTTQKPVISIALKKRKTREKKEHQKKSLVWYGLREFERQVINKVFKSTA